MATLGNSVPSRLCLYPPSSSQLTNQSAHADDVLPGTRGHTQQPEETSSRCGPPTMSASAKCSWLSVTPLRACCAPSSWAWKCWASTLSRVASILKGCAFLGGYSQTTPVPGTLELTWQCRIFVGGDDYQSGQTKVRFVLTDFLIVSGLKTLSIVSYSHLATMTGRTRWRQHSSAPRRCPRAAWYTMCWYTATQRSTCRARSQVTAWSSGTWATASVSWISTQQSGCWAVPTGWNCATHSRTRSWPIPSRRTWSRCQTMPACDPLHKCQPRATELPTSAVAARFGFLLQAQLGRWGSPVANPLFRQHQLH